MHPDFEMSNVSHFYDFLGNSKTLEYFNSIYPLPKFHGMVSLGFFFFILHILKPYTTCYYYFKWFVFIYISVLNCPFPPEFPLSRWGHLPSTWRTPFSTVQVAKNSKVFVCLKIPYFTFTPEGSFPPWGILL